MALNENDFEFKSREERNERLKNIDYQIEDEKQELSDRRKKEKTRLDRMRARERKKQAELTAQKKARKEEAEKKNLAKKKEQEEARSIMEQKRVEKKNQKNPKKNISSVTSSKKNTNDIANFFNPQTNSSGKTVDSAFVSSMASELARSNVKAEISVDGKNIAENATALDIDNLSNSVAGRELPQDLIERIKKEQRDAIRQTEEEIKKANEDNMSDKDRIMKETNEYVVAKNKLSRGYKAEELTAMNAIRTPTNFQVQGKNTPINGKFNAANRERAKTQQDDSYTKSEMQNNTNDQNFQETSQKNNDISEMVRNGNVNRDNLKAYLMNANRVRDNNIRKNDPNGIFMDPQDNVSESSGDGGNNVQVPTSGAMSGVALGASAIAAASRRSGTGGGTAGIPQSIEEDVDSQVSNDISKKTGAALGAAGTVGKGAMGAVKTVTTAMKAKKMLTMGALVAGGGILTLIILLVVGVTSFFMNMPGMVRDKLADHWDNFWQTCKGAIVGQDKPTKTDIINYAEYLEDNMKYDLVYNGFATKITRDEKGKIVDVDSKYLPAYIAAEQRSYLIANENHNVLSIWEGVKDSFFTGIEDLFGIESEDKSEEIPSEFWGTGMICLEKDALTTIAGPAGTFIPSGVLTELIRVGTDLWDYFFEDKGTKRDTKVENLDALTERVRIKRDTKEIYISNVNIVDVWNTGGYDVYRYSIKEWTEKYSLPTELSFTLHLATRAPEFAYNFATSYDTKVYLNVKKITDVDIELTYVKKDENGQVVLDEKNQPVMVPISELTAAEREKMGISTSAYQEMQKVNTRIDAFTPYITKVINHWYYQQVIFQGTYKETEDTEKNIDVYEIRDLSPGDEGYERYYAYTVRDNADTSVMKADKETEKPKGPSLFMKILDYAIQIMIAYFTGNYSGFSGIFSAATDVVMDEAFDALSDVAIAEVQDLARDVLPNELVGMIDFDSFKLDGLSISSLQNLENGINLDNMSSYLDFDKMTEAMSIDNLSLNVEKMWDNLNLQEELMNMDLAGLGSINDLQNVVDQISTDNLTKVISDKFGEIADLSKVNFEAITNDLANGFTSSLGEIQDSILKVSDELFAGLSEVDFNFISDRMLGDVSKKLSELSSAPILEQLEGSIKGVVDKIDLDGTMLPALQNEFSKQLTGLSYTQLSDLAVIKDMDFNQLKELSGEVTGVADALKGAEDSMTNLSHSVNNVSRELTGMDTKVFGTVVDGLTQFDTKMDTLTTGTTETIGILNGMDLSDPNVARLSEEVNTLNKKTSEMKEAMSTFDMNKVNQLQNDINTCKANINSAMRTVKNLDDITIGRIEDKITTLDNQITNVVEHLTSMDTGKFVNLRYKMQNIDKSGVIELANTLYDLDPSSNGMKELAQKYGTDLTNLNTSEINVIMDRINGENLTSQEVINTIMTQVRRTGAGDELLSNLNQLNSRVNSLKEATTDLDAQKVANLASKVPGLDKLQLNNFASQIAGLQNVTVDKLLNQVEELPKQIVTDVTNQMKDKIVDGVKEQFSQNIADKVKGKMTGDGSFMGDLKSGMTGGGNGEVVDTSAREQDLEKSLYEYSTGFYVRERRRADYFQVAEPVRVLYSPRHWIKMFREDEYVILNSPSIDLTKIDDPEYLEESRQTIWEATGGNIENTIYAMLQSIQSAESEYLLRYFKELFNDFSFMFKDTVIDLGPTVDPTAIYPDTIGWIFKTATVEEPIFTGERKELSKVEKEVIETISYVTNNSGTTMVTTYSDTNADNAAMNLNEYIQKGMPQDAVNFAYDLEVVDGKPAELKAQYVNDKNEITEKVIKIDEYTTDMNLQEIAENETPSGYRFVKIIQQSIYKTVSVTYYKYEHREMKEVKKAEYEPYTWSASRIGILTPKAQDVVYGFDVGLDIVSPVDGVIVAKTERSENELGEVVPASITIELRNTGDENADGMRIIIIGGEYNGVGVGTLVKKAEYQIDKDGNYVGEPQQSIIGKTTNETIRIMVLDKDQTPVDNISEFLYPPFQEYKALRGDESNERQ